MSLSDHNETFIDQEKEFTSRSPPPIPTSPNSPQQVLDSTINDTVVPLTIAPLASITSTPLQPAFTRTGPSRISPFFLTPRSLIRHPPQGITEPIAQRRRVHDDLATLHYTVNAMDKERVEIIEGFNNLHARQVMTEDSVDILRLEMEASARREEALREKLEASRRRIARQEERMESFRENQRKILEAMVAKAEMDTQKEVHENKPSINVQENMGKEVRQKEIVPQTGTSTTKPPPIVDWESILVDNLAMFKITRVDGSTELYRNVTSLFKAISRDDLVEIYEVGKGKYPLLQGKYNEVRLLMEWLLEMFEPELYPIIDIAPVMMWKLFSNCGVYQVTLHSGRVMFFLVDREYRHSMVRLQGMAYKRLKLVSGDNEEMRRELIGHIKVQILTGHMPPHP